MKFISIKTKELGIVAIPLEDIKYIKKHVTEYSEWVIITFKDSRSDVTTFEKYEYIIQQINK